MRTLHIAAMVVAATVSSTSYAQSCRSGDAGFCMKGYGRGISLVEVSSRDIVAKQDLLIDIPLHRRPAGSGMSIHGRADDSSIVFVLEGDRMAQIRRQVEKAEREAERRRVADGVEKAFPAVNPAQAWLIASMQETEREMAAKSASDPLGIHHEDQRGYPCSGAVPSRKPAVGQPGADSETMVSVPVGRL